jgi:hypothetical protein
MPHTRTGLATTAAFLQGWPMNVSLYLTHSLLLFPCCEVTAAAVIAKHILTNANPSVMHVSLCYS